MGAPAALTGGLAARRISKKNVAAMFFLLFKMFRYQVGLLIWGKTTTWEISIIKVPTNVLLWIKATFIMEL